MLHNPITTAFCPDFFEMRHFLSPSYIAHHNSHTSNNYFYSSNTKTMLRVYIKNREIFNELVCCGYSIQFIVRGFRHRT